MLEKIFQPILKVVGIVASSLTGMSAAFTAIGFLAERSHLVMLGFTTIPVDLNQYLYTGARFMAFLPFILLNSLGIVTTKLASAYFFEFLIAIIALIALFFLFRIPALRRFKSKTGDFLKKMVQHHRSVFLFLFLILQFVIIAQLLVGAEISNLLFETPAPENTTASIWQQKSAYLSNWIITNNTGELFNHMGWLFFLSAISIVIMAELLSTYRTTEITKLSVWQRLWLGLNVLLLATQLLLIPINYGKLLLPSKYPQISIQLEETTDPELLELEKAPASLLYQDGGTFYIYSSKANKVWLIRSGQLKSLSYLGIKSIF